MLVTQERHLTSRSLVHQRRTADLGQRVSCGPIHGPCMIADVLDSTESTEKPTGTLPTPHKPPPSMPTFVTRRPVPPQRKKDIPKLTDRLPALPQEEEAPVPEAKAPPPESTSNPLADAQWEKVEVPYSVDSKPISTAEPPPPSKDEPLVLSKKPSPSTSSKPRDRINVPEDTRAPSPVKGDLPPGKKLVGTVEGRTETVEPLVSRSKGPNESDTTVDAKGGPKVHTTVPGVVRDQPEKKGEVTKQERIAGPVDSGNVGTVSPFEGTLREEQKPPAEGYTPSAKNSMSNVDAKEVIGQGISLKERLAALQVKGGLDPEQPPPKPTTEKPKWTPSLKPVGPPAQSEKKAPANFETVTPSPPLDTELTETPAEKPTEPQEGQGRVAIATRMKPSGETRIRKGPPVIAPKPVIRRPSVPKEKETQPGKHCIQSLDGALH